MMWLYFPLNKYLEYVNKPNKHLENLQIRHNAPSLSFSRSFIHSFESAKILALLSSAIHVRKYYYIFFLFLVSLLSWRNGAKLVFFSVVERPHQLNRNELKSVSHLKKESLVKCEGKRIRLEVKLLAHVQNE